MRDTRNPHSTTALPRRTVLAGMGAAGLLAATAGTVRATAPTPSTRRSVAVFGGGMAGLTVAHELAERGFDVTVHEPTALGGKARSITVGGTAAGGRGNLPGEHGFRFFPGFYQHIPDTMRRIPFAGNANGVLDNLVAAGGFRFARPNGDDLMMPAPGAPTRWEMYDLDTLRESLAALFAIGTSIPPHEIQVFLTKLLTSSRP